jgi:hypothetical protein
MNLQRHNVHLRLSIIAVGAAASIPQAPASNKAIPPGSDTGNCPVADEPARVKTGTRTLRALRDPLNWIGGALVAGGLFLASASLPVALAGWLAYEAVFLIVAPRTGRYGREGGRESAALWEGLLASDRERLVEISRLCDEIAAGVPETGLWREEIVGRLDGLQGQFLSFARKRAEYHALLRGLAEELGTAPLDSFGQPLPPRGRERALAAAEVETLRSWVREGYDRRLAAIEAELARESDPESRALVERRREMTDQLRASAAAVGETARNVERQLDLAGDSVRLIHAQFRARPPEQILPEVEEVVRSSRALADALAEVAPLEEKLQQLRRA